MFVIGAILTFAVNVDLGGGVNLDLIGYILMGAGLVVFLVGIALMVRRRESVSTVQSGVDATGAQVTQRRTSETPDTPVL